MRSLIAREWRENRALIYGFLAVAPVLSLLLKWLLIGWEKTQARDSVEFVIPGMLALFVMAIAADLVSGDSASGRHSFFAALPVRPATVWSAKAAFLFGSTAAFLGYLVFLETAILGIAGKDGLGVLAGVEDYSHYLTAFVLLGAATLFWSTLLDRGFTAAFAALVSIAMIVGAILWYRIGRFHLTYRREAVFAEAALVVTTGFLAGSFLAFTRGRIHLGTRVRRAVLALAALIVILVPAGAQAAIRLERWMDIRPTDERISARLAHVDPSGTWAFVGAGRIGVGPLGARSSGPGPWSFFAIHLGDGRIRNLTDYGGIHHREQSFLEPGRVKLHRDDPMPGENRLIRVIVDYDLEAGTPITTRAWDPGKDQVPAQWNKDIPTGWSTTSRRTDWGVGVCRYHGHRRFGILRFDTGEIREVDSFVTVLPPEPHGDAFSLGRVIRRLPVSGSDPEIITREATWHQVSPTNRHALAIVNGELLLISVEDGTLRRIPCPSGKFRSAMWSTDGKTFVAITETAAYTGRPEKRCLTPYCRLSRAGGVRWFDGRRLIVTNRFWRKLFVAEEGEAARPLFPLQVTR